MNQKDWKNNKNLIIKVKGLFRNSGWKVKQQTYSIKENLIELEIRAEHSGGLSAMVLTPFEVIEKVQLDNQKDHYQIRVIIDGDEYITRNL